MKAVGIPELKNKLSSYLAEVRELDSLIDALHGALAEALPASSSFARAKQAEERHRDRR